MQDTSATLLARRAFALRAKELEHDSQVTERHEQAETEDLYGDGQ